VTLVVMGGYVFFLVHGSRYVDFSWCNLLCIVKRTNKMFKTVIFVGCPHVHSTVEKAFEEAR
jgi:hypothetical protein